MLYNALCGTVALNDLENVSVFNQCLGRERGFLEVPAQDYSKTSDFGTLSLSEQPITTSKPKLSAVPIERIDDLGLVRLDFLKIDVEGMEIDVLMGGSKTIDQYRPWCWIEYWRCDKKELMSFFAKRNYMIYRMDDLNVLCAPIDKLDESRLRIDAPLFE